VTNLERELVWLLEKVQKDEKFIQAAEVYRWSRGFTAFYMDTLQRMKDQLYFEEHRLEQISWRIIQQREVEIGVTPRGREVVADRVGRVPAHHRVDHST
jgi:hypothetical protein